jgi:hypothetical protein
MGEEMLLRPEADVVEELVDSYRLDVPVLHADLKVRVEQGEVKGSPETIRVVFAMASRGSLMSSRRASCLHRLMERYVVANCD